MALYRADAESTNSGRRLIDPPIQDEAWVRLANSKGFIEQICINTNDQYRSLEDGQHIKII
jgi:hypothetical protein